MPFLGCQCRRDLGSALVCDRFVHFAPAVHAFAGKGTGRIGADLETEGGLAGLAHAVARALVAQSITEQSSSVMNPSSIARCVPFLGGCFDVGGEFRSGMFSCFALMVASDNV